MSQLEKVASNLAVNYVVPHVSGIPGVKKVVGFRESGVKKGSIAAMAQSYQGDVKAGSTFSRMQSESSAKGGYARQQTTATSRHGSAPGTKPSSGKNSSGPKMSHTSNKTSSYKNKSGK